MLNQINPPSPAAEATGLFGFLLEKGWASRYRVPEFPELTRAARLRKPTPFFLAAPAVALTASSCQIRFKIRDCRSRQPARDASGRVLARRRPPTASPLALFSLQPAAGQRLNNRAMMGTGVIPG
jgi:hypothetical protein